MEALEEAPWEYSFPPFFTLQPNEETRRRQLATWADWVLAYTKRANINRLVVADAPQMELFSNRAIARSLNADGIRSVLDYLEQRGNLEWIDGGTSCLLIWQSPARWAQLLYDWAVRTGNTDTVCTFYELREGESTESEPFHGIDAEMLRKAVAALQREHKAELIQMNDAPNDLEDGIKFF
ncbi:uncharacterized protein MONBRDRAFT_15611 [Monosiga brevicollis MX1]|uniref:Vacuolar protein-sorting-associated protein 25 n=1 Tax=Monosiga brevicollis TaxID=81824 RepID=A9UUY8_MONBE|nr:uncharacterized protein MONBRDRAFT_15611 [Monosiga brevicollis MX1]EDQ90799.1 predicted protein [Monosiga brevicollis MX1]|eukprot:XP_001744096.1 hypothetical protein [Monosiga brevicollis MX1]